MLGIYHKELIQNSSGWLDGPIINGIQLKLKAEFPLINGLQDTGLNGLASDNFKNIPRFRPLPQNGFWVQIIHLESRAHWICVAGNSAPSDNMIINVYDSLNTNILNNDLISQVSSFFKCHKIKTLEFVFHKVSLQHDTSSCGIHSITNSMVLCNGGYPECHIYFLNEMRSELISIIENDSHCKLFSSIIFDELSIPTSIKAEPVFCYCRKRYDGNPMVRCHRCYEWFHFTCLGSSFNENMTEFFCDYCSYRNAKRLTKK